MARQSKTPKKKIPVGDEPITDKLLMDVTDYVFQDKLLKFAVYLGFKKTQYDCITATGQDRIFAVSGI